MMVLVNKPSNKASKPKGQISPSGYLQEISLILFTGERE